MSAYGLSIVHMHSFLNFLLVRFLTDLAVNAKSCLNSNEQ